MKKQTNIEVGNAKATIASISPPLTMPHKEGVDLVKRLYELGLRPGIQVEIIGKVSFKSVTILQFGQNGQTRLALNEQEFECLRGL